jgi:hypothetical protein
MIMSVVNCSVKMSVWGYGKDTDIEQEGTEAVKGIKRGRKGKDGDGGGG